MSEYIDRPDLVQSKQAAASGVCDIIFNPDTKGRVQLIDRIVISSDSSSTPECFVYVGDVSDENLIDYTDSGKRDVSENTPAIKVAGSRAIVVRWTGCSASAKCTARIQRRIQVTK
jgi:hypothetical protein